MQEFREALKVFLRESCEFLASQPPGSREWVRIVRQGDGSTSFPTEVRPDFSRPLLRLRMRCHGTSWPVFDRLVDTVCQKTTLRSVFLVDARGNPIQGEGNERGWLENKLAGSFVYAYVNKTRGVQFDEQAFNDLFSEFRRDIESSDITVTEVSPLMNAEVESDQIQTEPGIRLRQLSTDELEKWMNADWFFPMLSFPFDQLLNLQCAVEVVYQQNRHAAFDSNSNAHQKVSRLMTAMRLLTDGSPRLGFTTTRTSSLLTQGFSTSWGASILPIAPLAKIVKSQEPELIGLYIRLGSSPNIGNAALALARWDSAGDRLTEDDKLIDYWIALESLFVPDVAQELSYRACLRIAAFLGGTGLERERLYQGLRDSYQLRSEIVHGSIGKRKKKLSASELNNLTRSCLRQALMKVLESDQQFNAAELESVLLRGE